MKPLEFYISVVLASLCLVTTGIWIGIVQVNKERVTKVQEQEKIIRDAQMSQQVTGGVVRQLAELSLKNDNVKVLLSKHGVTVTPNTGAAK